MIDNFTVYFSLYYDSNGNIGWDIVCLTSFLKEWLSNAVHLTEINVRYVILWEFNNHQCMLLFTIFLLFKTYRMYYNFSDVYL